MIVIERLTKTFPERTSIAERVKRRFVGRRRLVLDDISLTAGRGELLGILGANGAGKTTLMQVLATLSRGDTGVVTVGGVHVDADPGHVRRSIGYCGSAERGFYYRLTVRENLRFFAAIGRQLAANASERRIDAVLELVDLHDQRDRLYAQLSSGMRQRLAIARALLGDPPVLLFDEPTRAVDPTHAESIRTLIRTTLVDQFGKTVVMATNVLEEAWAMCHRIAVLRAGRVIALGAPHALQVARGSTTRYRIVVDRAGDELLERIRGVPGFAGLTIGTGDDAGRLDVDIDALPTTLTALLRAVGVGDCNVVSFQPQLPTPAEVFAGLMSER